MSASDDSLDREIDAELQEFNLNVGESFDGVRISTRESSPDAMLPYRVMARNRDVAQLASAILGQEWNYTEYKSMCEAVLDELHGHLEEVLDLVLRISTEHALPFKPERILVRMLTEEWSDYVTSKSQRYLTALQVSLPPATYASLCNVLDVAIPVEEARSVAEELLSSRKTVQDGFLYAFKTGVYRHLTSEELLDKAIKLRSFGPLQEFLVQLDVLEDKSAAHCMYAITNIAERSGAGSPATSLKLIKALGFSPDDYPRVQYIQRKEVLRWCVAAGVVGEFEHILCYGSCNDSMLQRFVCRQALKREQYTTLHKLTLKYDLVNDPEFVHAKGLHEKKTSLGKDLEVVCLPKQHIVLFVHDETSLAQAVKMTATWTEEVLGVDMEFIPDNIHAFVPSKRPTTVCQLLQISSASTSILIDLPACSVFPQFESLLSHILSSSRLHKVGMGLQSDLKMLRRTFPECRCFSKVEPYSDLAPLTKAAREQIMAQSKNGKKPADKGLALAARHFLGKRLDKTEQISNWCRRPLLPRQIQYAAIDAYVCTLLIKHL